jgi:antitoxin MazE
MFPCFGIDLPCCIYNIDTTQNPGEETMQTSVAKWGNSLAVRLPRNMAADLNLAEGSSVELRVEGKAIIVTPIRRKYSLDELLAGLTRKHRRGETDWDSPTGEEVW